MWIEIPNGNITITGTETVTLHTESVDWNKAKFQHWFFRFGHSPYGECGLKCFDMVLTPLECSHSPYGECGLKLIFCVKFILLFRHSPYGECGLKYLQFALDKGQERVTLHTESVDWNSNSSQWLIKCCVTLHTESVDWNSFWSAITPIEWRHSPYGECGLKLQ